LPGNDAMNDAVCSTHAKKAVLKKRWSELSSALLEADVCLLAVSKYAPDEAVQILIDAGQRDFGESRPQNLRDRAQQWPDCAWHMIGPVQKNKAKYIGRFASAWHSCECLETAKVVARYVEAGRVLPVFIQLNIANITHQHGVLPADLPAFAEQLLQIEGLSLAGLMCMAPRDGDAGRAFADLRRLRAELLGALLGERAAGLSHGLLCGRGLQLCMGMSGDYRIAVQEGSDMVRLGSTLFGDWDVR